APSTITAMSVHTNEFPSAVVQLDDRTDPFRPQARPVRLVFTDDNGRPIRPSAWSRAWKKIRDDANKLLAAARSDVRVPEKLTLHGLRDLYASALIKHNENVNTL
ncbi:MAG: hypothetical protein QOF98_2468, partial [Streptomyces sp.]|nr:hypothetical protein [Streptomyces sp.]